MIGPMPPASCSAVLATVSRTRSAPLALTIHPKYMRPEIGATTLFTARTRCQRRLFASTEPLAEKMADLVRWLPDAGDVQENEEEE